MRKKLCYWLCTALRRTLVGEDEKTGRHSPEKTGHHWSGGVKLHGAATGMRIRLWAAETGPEKTGRRGADGVKLHGEATRMRIRQWAAQKTGSHMSETMGRHGAGQFKMHGAADREQISCHWAVQFNLHGAVTGQIRAGDHM